MIRTFPLQQPTLCSTAAPPTARSDFSVLVCRLTSTRQGSSRPGTPAKRKPCNCKNSKCLKLYCECFASGEIVHVVLFSAHFDVSGLYCEVQCNCHSCHNNVRFEWDRQAAVVSTLERNPHAFRPKITQTGQQGIVDSPAKVIECI